MILAILFAVLGYKVAKRTGRNKILWAVLMALIFIAVQLAVFGVGVFGALWLGWDPALFDTYAWPINIGGWVLGGAVCAGALYLLGRTSAETNESSAQADLGID